MCTKETEDTICCSCEYDEWHCKTTLDSSGIPFPPKTPFLKHTLRIQIRKCEEGEGGGGKWTGANGKRKVAGGNFIEKSEWKRAQAKKYECLRNATPAA